MTLNDGVCRFPSLKSCPWFLSCVYNYILLQCVYRISTMQFPLPLSLFLSSALLAVFLAFTHNLGQQLLKRFNLKYWLAYFTSPSCFYTLYSVVAGKMFHWHCIGMPVVTGLCMYLHTVCATSLFLQPSGVSILLFTLEIQHDKENSGFFLFIAGGNALFVLQLFLHSYLNLQNLWYKSLALSKRPKSLCGILTRAKGPFFAFGDTNWLALILVVCLFCLLRM